MDMHDNVVHASDDDRGDRPVNKHEERFGDTDLQHVPETAVPIFPET